jgi:hypothetical protein
MRAHRELTAWAQSLARGAYAAERLRALLSAYAIDDPAIPPAAAHLVTCLRDARDEKWIATPMRIGATVRGVLSELEEIARPRRLLDEADVREAWEEVCVAIDALASEAAVAPAPHPAPRMDTFVRTITPVVH